MWWLDPGKEVLHVLFNRILAPYVINLDLNQVNYGIGQGQLTLHGLKLKKGALDKFQLPVDVLEGHLGKFQLSLHWMNLGNQPVEILIEDVFLLVVPSPQTNANPEEDEQRGQTVKQERLESAELLYIRSQESQAGEPSQSPGLIQSLITKIINNVQVTVKNVHMRYEDNVSVSDHPFAAGVMLSGFTAVSVNSNWEPAFIESTAGAVHKLASLQSLAVYFDTDSPSMAGLPTVEFMKRFSSMVSDTSDNGRQYILHPVSGEGRMTVNHMVDRQTPRFDIQLLFEEIAVSLDAHQYRDVISLVDMYHVYLRKRQYGKYRPSDADFASNTARARIHYATNAILEEVREKKRQWTWAYFAERRDDRNEYVGLFQKRLLNILVGQDLPLFEALERKLSYEDIRFYRSISRSKLKKDIASKKKMEETKKQVAKQSWSSWLWGPSSPQTQLLQEDHVFGGTMTEEQRRQLYEVLDYDEKAAVISALEVPRDSIKLRASAKLKRGSFALRNEPDRSNTEVTSVVFDLFHATFVQRPASFAASISLNSFKVYDGTTMGTLYSQIVRVKSEDITDRMPAEGHAEPFFFIEFENNPLDGRADNALTVRMRHMEVIYHRGYIQAIFRFLKPPASQLESVEALLNVASKTLEGLRKETRAGLEYALQTHKTIDIHMDLNAPILIVPEDVTANDCKHLVIDAGHIAIESDLASKDAIRTIHQKRYQKYNDEDYRQLESLMYDKLFLRFQDAQFIIGDNLEACRESLTSDATDTLHLLERINISLQIQRSIVPTAVNLAQFKISGTLPSLQLNLSDTKYKSLMRLIDIAIPKFDEETVSIPPDPSLALAPSFQLPPLFGQAEHEYHIDDVDHQAGSDETGQYGQSFDANDGTVQKPEFQQHMFELDFRVDKLCVTVSKSSKDGTEKPVGDLQLEGFSLAFIMSKYIMNMDIHLSSVAMNLVQHAGQNIQFVSTAEHSSSGENDLLRMAYTRAQKESPDFLTIHESIDQNVDIKMSTLIFRSAPEPVLALYDFIMTTFASKTDETVHPQTNRSSDGFQEAQNVADSGTIRVLVKLEGVQVILINEMIPLATLSFSIADVSILLRPKTLRVSGRLGNLTLVNENSTCAILGDFNQLMSIDGPNFADFVYQTLDVDEANYRGVKSSISFNAASVKFNFVEQPLRDLYVFVYKLARLKGLYDAATQVAVQKASEIERMQFAISVKSPIIIFPYDPISSVDTLVLRLGHITAKNKYEAVLNQTSAGLYGLQFVSNIQKEAELSTLRVIDDIDISAEIIQTSDIDRQVDIDCPDTQVAVKISDVKLHLTQLQYCHFLKLATDVSRVFAAMPSTELENGGVSQAAPLPPIATGEARSTLSLRPELRAIPQRPWTSLDFVVSVLAVKLRLYDSRAYSEQQLKEHGIARFALNNSSLRLKLLSDGSGEAQVVLKSFTMSNTGPGPNLFREVVPAAQHDRNQFMLLYSMTCGPNSSSQAVLTVDSPRVIFAVDPVISLLEFFSPAGPRDDGTGKFEKATPHSLSQQPVDQGVRTLDIRIDLHDVSVSVLENDADAGSQAIRLHVARVSLCQQAVLALTVNRLGMSLMRMDQASESVRILDDVDLTFTLDSRATSCHQMTSIEIVMKTIVLRASYRDINLITSITTVALARYNESQQPEKRAEAHMSDRTSSSTQEHTAVGTQARSVGKARVLMTKEQLKGSFDGFRLILIGDLHEQPMLHLKVKPFIIGAKDWSGQLHVTMTMAISITYWNLSKSHWEPLIDPWIFAIDVSKLDAAGGLQLTFSARERLDVNITSNFVEFVLIALKTWNEEGGAVLHTGRGTYAPYRIWNRTGSPILVWPETDSLASSKGVDAFKIENEQTIDWRFDDWKTMREHVCSSQHSIGIQFLEKSWEQLRAIPVDRGGEFVYTLRPKTHKYPDRLLCEVAVVDNTKVITIRSTFKVENLTLYPLEIMLIGETGHPVYSPHKVVPGDDFHVPIDLVTTSKTRIQPDQGFGYKWCSPVRWEDLISRKSFTWKCIHSDPKEVAFRLQAWVQTDLGESSSRKYPKMTLKLRAPLELENLLPYNLEYRLYDKNTDQNWRSYLRKGGVMPVHAVELDHFILLNITVQDTAFKPSDFAIINTDGHSNFEIETSLTLRDQLDRNLNLRLNYIRHPESGGAFKVQIYSPYVVVNKSGLPFLIKSVKSTRASTQEVAGETSSDILATPSPYLLSHSQKHGHEFVFKFLDSSWSKPISFEAPAAETEINVVSQKQKTDVFHIGLSWTEGLGKYKLSKVVILAPRFLIANQLAELITFREHGVSPPERTLIDPEHRSPLLVLRSNDEKLLTIAYPGLNAQWSPPINIEDIGAIHFLLRHPDGRRGPELVRADVQIDGSTISITYSPAAEGWPFLIENLSDFLLNFCQQDARRDPAAQDRPQMYSLEPHTSKSYAWDYPAARDKKIQLIIGSSRRVIDIMEIGDLMPFKFTMQQRSRIVSLDVRADGDRQILRITNYNPNSSLYRPRQRNSSALPIARQDTISSSIDAFEAVSQEINPIYAISIDLAGVGVSLINKEMVEVIYLVMDSIKFNYTNSTVAQSMSLSCGHLQIDNQLHEGLYPVILQPSPISKDTHAVGALPTMQTSVIWLKDQEHGVLFIKYCSILLQALTIEADEDLLFAIYDLTKIKGVSWEEGTADVLIPYPQEIPVPSASAAGEHLYFELLELQPIKLSLSFMRTERINSEEKLSIRNPLAVVLNAFTMAVGNINDAPLELNALAIRDMRLTLPELQSRITYHYRQDVLRQLYRLLGSVDFIGNPVGLFTNVSSGVADIFYEPFQGVVMHGNKELGIGIAKGAASFVKKTVFGVSDSVTKFTSSVGKGLSAATFDSEFQTKRRMSQRRNKPRHAIYGVAAGGEAFASSVTSAMEGVFGLELKPIEGAESEGAFGFFKGVGKGLVGAVTKPVVGVFDLASNVSEGIRNTTTVFDSPERDRIRLPRLIPYDGVLRSYSSREALGQSWMKDLNNGAYRNEHYVAHINSLGTDNVVLLTASRMLSFWSKKLNLSWELPFMQIKGITVEDKGIRFAHKAGEEHDKFAVIQDKATQSWFFSQVASVVKSFNARRRMDD